MGWPVDKGAIKENQWNLDAAGFVKLVQDNPGFWPMDSDLKYLNIRIDTRDGGFLLLDRDDKRISPDRVVKAIEKYKEFLGGRQ